MRRFKRMLSAPWAAALAVVLIGCGGMAIVRADKPDYQAKMEHISDLIASQLTAAVPYPVSGMRDSLERRMLRERLLRFNKASKIGYVYLFNLGSNKPIGYYVIRGKVSATQSQLSNPTQTWNHGCSSSNGACAYMGSADSIGDDGSFGDEEGGPQGIFFFDSSGVMHETTLVWQYADAPIAIWQDTPNLTAKAAPSSTSAYWKQQNGLGGTP